MEWRPQKEGIATEPFLKLTLRYIDGMETSKRRDCDIQINSHNFLLSDDGMETSKRRDCDPQP